MQLKNKEEMKYHDSGYDFYMRRITRDETLSEVVGDWVNIEEVYEGLVYKSMSGLDTYGKPRSYVENYVESDKASVWVDEVDSREQTTLKFTAYFFDAAGNKDEAKAIEAIETVYRNFVAFVSACQITYRDTARKRKVRMYLSDEITAKTDRLYGIVYKEVEFDFTNVYGRSFPYDYDGFE